MADYPSISFSTKVSYPPTQSSQWRDTIGVVGEFSKGPAEPLRVDPQSFSDLYGYDSSPGSVAVQQAISLGASNFIISRAVPGDSSSKADISFASKNSQAISPTIGYYVDGSNDYALKSSPDRTLGLELKVNYIGSPITVKNIYSPVVTRSFNIDHTKFSNEEATLRLYVVGFTATSGTTLLSAANTLTVNTADTALNGYQIVTISKSNDGSNAIDDLVELLKPGNTLKTTTQTLHILSNPFEASATHWGLLVKTVAGTTTAATVPSWEVHLPDADVYTIGYKIVTESGSTVEPEAADTTYAILPGAFYTQLDGTQVRLDGYFPFFPATQSASYINFQYITRPSAYNFVDPGALGLEDFGNSESSGEGIYFKFGTTTSTDIAGLLLGGEVWIPFAVGSALAGAKTDTNEAFEKGTNGDKVIDLLRKAIYQSNVVKDVINDIDVTTTFPYTVTLHSAFSGVEANRIKYQLVRYKTAGEVNDFLIKIDESSYDITEYGTWVNMEQGIEGPTFAQRDFYTIKGERIIRVRATSPGATDIYVTLSSPTYNGGAPSFLIEVKTASDGPVLESAYIRMSSVDTTTGLFNDSSSLRNVSVFFLPTNNQNLSGQALLDSIDVPARVAPPLAQYSGNYNTGITGISHTGAIALTNVKLLGGQDYNDNDGIPPLTQQQLNINRYLGAVKRLASQDVAFIIIAGLPYGSNAYSTVFDEAIRQVKAASPESGLRQLILEAPPNMPANQAYILSSSIDSELVTVVNGSLNIALESGQTALRVGATGFYAGMLASRPPYVSPHASYDARFPAGILSTTQELSPEFKNNLTRGRVDSIHFDRGIGRWKFLNGLTTSSDPTKRYVSVVRIRLQIMSDLQSYLQWILSSPNSRALQSRVETQVNAYMQSKLQEGWFLRVGDIVCNESNNTEADMARGRLYLDISYVPIVPADYAFVTLTEDYTLLESFEFATRPNT